VVGEATDGASALPAIQESRPDVVLLDLSMPGVDGLEAIPRIREQAPTVGIVVFSGLAAGRMRGPALGRGADRYLEKGEPFEAVRRAIRDVARSPGGGGGAPDAGGRGQQGVEAELHRVNTELQRRAVELERSNNDLEQFTSAASHDLAEPLRVITGFANLLARRYQGRLDDEADKYIESILGGVDRMQDMIDALLAYSHVGRAEPVRTLVNCAELVREVLGGLRGAIDDTGASVTVDELPVVAGEPSLLGQLFQNLLSNAIKFRGERAPEVWIEARRRPGEWCFSVRDNGVGIDPRQAERVFGMFQRLATSEQPGTGVGLAICKRIVERHGGRIWVEPGPAGGSVFRFTIADPVIPPAPPR
jgi:signal transduction histidine kinase